MRSKFQAKENPELILKKKYMTCSFCKKPGQCQKLPSGETAHPECRDIQPCYICGIADLTMQCSHPKCLKVFHLTCLARYFPKSFSASHFLCHAHSKPGIRLYSKWLLALKLANTVGLEEQAAKEIKNSFAQSHTVNCCTGNVFWYVICAQYFPDMINLELPEIWVKRDILWDERDVSKDHDESELMFLCHESIKTIDDLIAEAQDKYDFIRKKNLELINEISLESTIFNTKIPKKEDQLILQDTRNRQHSPILSSFLKYVEKKATQEEPSHNLTKTKSGLRGPKLEEDFVCKVCAEGDYEDDDLIVICSKCEMGVHMHCYGIPVIPASDWYCEACLESPEERNTLKCALCTQRGGAIKKTIHVTSESLVFPNYSVAGETVWCHVFCAVHIQSGVVKDLVHMSQIDLTVIEPSKFWKLCIRCGSCEGACIKCENPKCEKTFHPECAKDLFLNTRNKTGFDEVKAYCLAHKPLKLKHRLESREKKCVEDIKRFSEAFNSYLEANKKKPPRKKQGRAKSFSLAEKYLLILEVEKVLKETESSKEFCVYYKSSKRKLRRKVEVGRPRLGDIFDPKLILENNIRIPGRSTSECYRFYCRSIYPLFKEEFQILKHIKTRSKQTQQPEGTLCTSCKQWFEPKLNDELRCKECSGV